MPFFIEDAEFVLVMMTGFISCAVAVKIIASAILKHQENKLRYMSGGQAVGAGATDARLERIEQAVDAIAIEIERISEAQRFTTKLLSEGPRSEVQGPR